MESECTAPPRRPRRADRPLYVPKKRPLEGPKRPPPVELFGRYGKIGDYEFEYEDRVDAAAAAKSIRAYKEVTPGGASLVQHVTSVIDPDMTERKILKSGVMRADLQVPCLNRKSLFDDTAAQSVVVAPRAALNKASTPDDQKLPIPRQLNVSIKESSLQSSAVSVSSESIEESQSSSSSSPSPPTSSSSFTAAAAAANDEDENSSVASRTTTQPLTASTFEHELYNRYPDALCRRLLHAIWLRLFYSSISQLQQQPSGHELLSVLESGLLYFETMLNRVKARPERCKEARHFLCSVCVILGDLHRYRDLHFLQARDNNSSDLPFRSSYQWYFQAREFFAQEGHLFSQWAYLSSYKGDILGQVLDTFRSTMTMFRYPNNDAVTILLASPPIEGGDNAETTFVRKFLLIIQSLYSKVRLDQYADELLSVITALNTTITTTTNASPDLYFKVVIESSGLWVDTAIIGDSISEVVNSIKLGVSTTAILAVEEESTYTTTRIMIKEKYNNSIEAFSEHFSTDLSDLISQNERLRLSCDLLYNMTSTILTAGLSPLSPLLAPASLATIWLAATGLLQDDISALSVRNAMVEFLDKLLQEISLEEITHNLLQYSLPEDTWLCGYVPTPLVFNVESNEKSHSIRLQNENQLEDITIKEQPEESINIHEESTDTESESSSSSNSSNSSELSSDQFLPTATTTTFIANQKRPEHISATHIRCARIFLLVGDVQLQNVLPEQQQEQQQPEKISNVGGFRPRGGLLRLSKPLRSKPKVVLPKRQNVFTNKKRETESLTGRLIVIDGANVARRHGAGKRYSCKGILIAVEYFRAKGAKVIVIVTDKEIDFNYASEKKRVASVRPEEVDLKKVPDGIIALQQLKSEGILYTTPPNDYDDAYILTYALEHNGCVVSNDKFRDYLKKASNNLEWQERRNFLKTYIISFMFIENEFIPNPDFKYPVDTRRTTNNV